jgi:hypothetical protein
MIIQFRAAKAKGDDLGKQLSMSSTISTTFAASIILLIRHGSQNVGTSFYTSFRSIQLQARHYPLQRSSGSRPHPRPRCGSHPLPRPAQGYGRTVRRPTSGRRRVEGRKGSTVLGEDPGGSDRGGRSRGQIARCYQLEQRWVSDFVMDA